MLVELAVADLGPIDRLSLVLGPGMTALTGETGAGKTLVTEAIMLLLGARADPSVVRAGAEEAVAEGRFLMGADEVVLRRVVPASGRSRAYIDGRLATAAELAEIGARMVDVHGQHGHQSLLRAAAQRDALDRFGRVDSQPLREIRQAIADAIGRREALGGDEHARAREIELYRFQLDELESAAIEGPDEGARLRAEEERLADAEGHRAAALGAADLLGGEQAGDAVGRAMAELAGRAPFGPLAERLAGIEAELTDLAAALRETGETIEDDPVRLAEVQQRQSRLQELRRKYGDTLGEVLDYRTEAAKRLAELESHDDLAATLDAELAELRASEGVAAAALGAARRAAAPALAEAVTTRLRALALPHARVEVAVGETDPGDDVVLTAAMNSGATLLPVAKVASGGELSRTMLALHLVLSAGPPVMVFDEVDAGVGGASASTVADALAELGRAHQVLVVTHLPQVAAVADHQVALRKLDDGDSVRTMAEPVAGEQRVVELARMLAGLGDSDTGQEHAREILEHAAERRASATAG